MQRLDLWANAKAVIRFPRTTSPVPKKVLPPVKRTLPHSKVVIYTQEMIEKYLHIPSY